MTQHTIELDHPGVQGQGLPTARCTKHGVGFGPETSRPPGTLIVTWTCPVCKEEMKTQDSANRA